MKRMVIVAVMLAACGNKAGSGGAGSNGSAGSSGGAGSNGSAGSTGNVAEPPPDDVTRKVVAKAFQGKVPAFPLLGATGTAAVAIATPLRLSDGSIYSVVFLPPGAGGPWDSVETIPLVDAMLAKLLAEGSPDGTTEPVFDRERLTTLAGSITTRLASGEFTPFEGMVASLSSSTTVGPVKLEQTSNAAGLQLQLVDPSGLIHATDNIPDQATSMVADQECMAKPVAKRAWYDTRRKRVLVELGWSIADPCIPPEGQYRLFALR